MSGAWVCSTAEHNWGGTGWIATLSAKYRVIAIDVRGHGLSDQPQSREAYGYASMGADVTRFMDHLGIERAAPDGLLDGREHRDRADAVASQRFRAIVLGGSRTTMASKTKRTATRLRRPTALTIRRRSKVRWQKRIGDSRSRCPTT